MMDPYAIFSGIMAYYLFFSGLAIGIGALFYIHSWRGARKK